MDSTCRQRSGLSILAAYNLGASHSNLKSNTGPLLNALPLAVSRDKHLMAHSDSRFGGMCEYDQQSARNRTILNACLPRVCQGSSADLRPKRLRIPCQPNLWTYTTEQACYIAG